MPLPGSLPAAPPGALTIDGGSFLAQTGLAVGNIYYVQSSSYNASDVAGTHGLTPQIPFKTLNFALGMCAPNQSDRVYVLPGHVENVVSAAGLTFATGQCDGVTVIFEGNEVDRGTINFATSTAAQVTITANNVTLYNARFTNAINGLVAGVSITGADCKLYNTQYYDGTSLASVIQLITSAAAVRLSIVGYYYYEGSAGASKTEAIRIVGGDHHRLTNLSIMGSFSTAVVNNVTTATTYLLGMAWNLTNLTASAPPTAFLSTSTFVGGDVSTAGVGGEVLTVGNAKTPNGGTANIFTVVGDIEVLLLGAKCTTVMQSSACTLTFNANAGALGAVTVNGAASVNAFPAGGVVACKDILTTTLLVASPATLGINDLSNSATTSPTQFAMVGGGVLYVTWSTTITGAMTPFVRWKPLSVGASVTAA